VQKIVHAVATVYQNKESFIPKKTARLLQKVLNRVTKGGLISKNFTLAQIYKNSCPVL
jgi:hypothetical protein